MIDIHMLFDFPAQGNPIHFWHHDITDDQVRSFFKYLRKGLFAVGAGRDMIVWRQLLTDVFSDFNIVINHQYAVFTLGLDFTFLCFRYIWNHLKFLYFWTEQCL